MSSPSPFQRVLSRLEKKEPEWRKKTSIQSLKSPQFMIYTSPPIQVFGSLRDALRSLGLSNTEENRGAILNNKEKWIRAYSS